MNIVALNPTESSEPVWDAVGIHSCDFRPHFDGCLHNLFTSIQPLESKPATEQRFRNIANEIAGWILSNRKRFGRGDRFQIIVGWPLGVRPTGRQVIKAGGDFDIIRRLVDSPELIQLRSGWEETTFLNTVDDKH